VFLAGTVAFPISFPSIGTISFEEGSWQLWRDEKPVGQLFVVVQEGYHHKQGVLRAARAEDVAAVFFAGERENPDDRYSRFRFSDDSRADNLENGEWFLHGEILPDTITGRLNVPKDQLRIMERASIAKGIIFVHEDRPLLTQVISTAGEASYGPQQRCSEC
jgi:hypothetical protein